MDNVEKIKYLVKNSVAYMNDGYNVKEAIGCLEEAFSLCDSRIDIGYYKIIIDSANGLTYTTKNAFQTSKVRKAYEEYLGYLVKKYKNIENYLIENDPEEFNYITYIVFMFYNRVDYLTSTFVNGFSAFFGKHGVLKPYFIMFGEIAHSSIILIEKYNDNMPDKQKYLADIKKIEKKYYRG